MPKMTPRCVSMAPASAVVRLDHHLLVRLEPNTDALRQLPRHGLGLRGEDHVPAIEIDDAKTLLRAVGEIFVIHVDLIMMTTSLVFEPKGGDIDIEVRRKLHIITTLHFFPRGHGKRRDRERVIPALVLRCLGECGARRGTTESETEESKSTDATHDFGPPAHRMSSVRR
jgi:hypothetical protein